MAGEVMFIVGLCALLLFLPTLVIAMVLRELGVIKSDFAMSPWSLLIFGLSMSLALGGIVMEMILNAIETIYR